LLLVIADDYGIGPATSRGILELAATGRVSGTVLLVNSPHAETAVRAWRQAGCGREMGWHACLTLDRPILPAWVVPSLVGDDGTFHPLGVFLQRLILGKLHPVEVAAELQAQYRRFIDLVGSPPSFVNGHHHIHCFGPIGRLLIELLARQRPLPYLRRVREPWRLLAQVPGARIKRFVLSVLGRHMAARQQRRGFPGNDWLAGITDPPCLEDPDCLVRWLRQLPGQVVELTCHPGHLDPTLLGRDGTLEDGLLRRRVRELQLLRDDRLPGVLREAGFILTAPSQLAYSQARRSRHVA
jgi:hypothetical protein